MALSSVFDSLRDKVTERTILEYTRRATMLLSATGRKDVEAVLKADAKEMYALLKKRYPVTSSRKGVVTMILSVFRHTPDLSNRHKASYETWSEIHRDLASLEQADAEDNRITPAMRAKMPTPAEMKAAKVKDPRASVLASQKNLVLRFFRDHPPKRMDFGALAVYHEKAPKNAKGNYIVIPKSKADDVTLVMHDFKTSKALGPLTEAFDADISRDIRESLKLFPRAYVFETASHKPMSETAYGKFVRDTFVELTGKAAGVTALRHAYITNNCDPTKKTVAELKKIAASMLHSYDVQQLYRLVD